MQKTNNDVPIFLQGTKAQKENKPLIEDTCDFFLKDKTLREGMARMLEFSHEIRMKPSWMAANWYQCRYKGKCVVTYNIAKENFLRVTIHLAEKDDLKRIMLAQKDDVIAEFFDRKTTHCSSCSPSTCVYGGASMEINGENHYYCSRFNYICNNPTQRQFKIMELFIELRRNYIDAKKAENKSW